MPTAALDRPYSCTRNYLEVASCPLSPPTPSPCRGSRAAALGDTERPVRSVTTGPRGFEGEGFPVVRAFAGVSKADLDPFVHMDQMGEVDYAPGRAQGHATGTRTAASRPSPT